MNTCRICLRKCSSLKPLFSEKNNLANRINDLFNFDFQIVQSDSDPQNICYDCMTDLHHAMKFYENARSAEHQLEMLKLETTEPNISQQNHVVEQSKLYVIHPGRVELEPGDNEVIQLDEGQELMEVVPESVKDEMLQSYETVNEEETEECIIEDNELQSFKFYKDSTDNKIIEEEYSIVRIKNNPVAISYECQYCSKSYDKKSSFQYHLKTKHIKEEDRDYQCSVCFKFFAVKSDYTRHQRIHSDQKRFSCSKCGKKFTDRSTHLKHEKIHTGIKPHTCDICFKSFTHKFVLTNHYLTHTGAKNFACPECSKRFSRKSKMKDHFSRIHKRPFTDEDEERSKEVLEKLLKDEMQDKNEDIEVTEVDDDLLESIVEISNQ